MQFLSGGLLLGLGLALVPLIIHLLNRRRFQWVEWAPMKYLKLTVRNNRRRIRIEQLILLLLRTLLMVLLVLTVARPVFSSGGIGAWLSRRARVSRIIVLDDSLSMGYRQNGRTALDQGKAAAREILRATGAQDAVTVLTTAPGATPLAREVSLDNPATLSGQIDALQPTDAACDWAATFKTIDDALSTATFPQKEVLLITDLRRNAWNGGVTALANHWGAQGVQARVVDVGTRQTSDVSLTRFIDEDSIALPGNTVKLLASIRNNTPSNITAAQAVLTVDGQARPVILPDLSAGATTDLPLSITLDKPGQHTLKFVLPDDPLPGDNVRYLTINVRERLDLNLVDGRPGAGPFESAGDFLELALTVNSAAWHVTRLSDFEFHAARADITAMVDAANISPAAADEYDRLVRLGMGLMIFAGEQADPDLYNQRLYRNGAGLLPVKLAHIIDGPVRGLNIEAVTDSPLLPLQKIVPAALARIETRRLMEVEWAQKTDESVRVLARWNDSQGHPAVIEKRLGRGRVLFFTTSADREWSDWPIDPTYVLAMRSAAAAIAWPDAGDDNLVAGRTLSYTPPDSGAVSNVRIITPTESSTQSIPALRYPHTERAGAYALTWLDANAQKQAHQFTASFDAKAADLEPITESQLSALLGGLNAPVVPYSAGIFLSSAPGREIWRTLASTLLALMVIESALAFWVGRER